MSNKEYPIVDSVESFEAALERVRAAQREFATFTQEQVDKIFLAAATAILARGSLARLAAVAAARKILSTCSCVNTENACCAALTLASAASKLSALSTMGYSLLLIKSTSYFYTL